MKKLLLIIASLISLSGCAGLSTKPPEVQIVKVPVPVPCPVPDIPKPTMYFDSDAKPGMDLYSKVQLLLAQDYNLKGYTKELEAAVNSCKAADQVSK